MEKDNMQVYIDVIEDIARFATLEASKVEENGMARIEEVICCVGASIESILDGVMNLLTNERIDSDLTKEGLAFKLMIAEILQSKTKDEAMRRLADGLN